MTSVAAIEGVKISSSGFHVEIQVNGKKETKMVTGKESLNGDRVVWNESISFSGIVISSILNFQIKARWSGFSYSVGSCQKKVADLLDLQNVNGSCKLEIGDATCQLLFNIKPQSESALLSDAVSGAEDGSTQIPTMECSTKFANIVTSVHDTAANQEDTWSSFLSQFSVFMAAMDQVAEIHPYAKMAWSVLSVIPKTIIAVKDRNDSIKNLVEKLKDTYGFITDAKRLPELKATQTNALSKLVKQTTECAYFIRDYSKAKLAKKALQGEKIDKQVKAFVDAFNDLKRVMTDSVTLETNIAMLRVTAGVTETKEYMLLQEMPYESRAGFASGKRCLSGTREGLIQEIIDWVNHDTPERMFVLSGAAGTGKSSIAHTIAERFKEQKRLGSLFCFSRSYKEMRNSLFSTISRQIADGDGSWQKSLIKNIQEKAIRASTDMDTQFQELIVKPSKETSTIGPVVIVIDALDESGDPNERQALLDILFRRLSELPENYRFILTTRPEQDIASPCQESTVTCKRMDDVSEKDTLLDIERYVSHRLKRQAKILDEIQEDWPAILAKRSEGLFQWAETACQTMDSLHRPQLLKKAWKACTSGASSSLYALYHSIISGQQECEDAEFMDDFRLIVGAIIMTREPFTTNGLENIFEGIVEDVKTILRPFGSLLVGVHDEFTPIRPLHTSLLDFFHERNLDGTNKNKYYVDTSDQSLFTSGCLQLMNRTLGFNICSLETSHLRNKDVPNFTERVAKAIPPHLSYACRFWGFHLQHSGERKDRIFPQLRTLMEEKLLYWFEALGLLGEVEKGCIAMRIMQNWCQGTDNELADWAADAEQFGFNYGDAINESMPHLYLSALPFTPSHSFISKQFSPFYPRLFRIEGGPQFDSVSKSPFVKKKSSSEATSLVFSPESKYIATGFVNGGFWFWNCESGEILYQWKGNKEWGSIYNIVFSLDGQWVYCCFERGHVRIWNVETRKTMDDSHLDILEGECAKCIVSSDGHYIIFLAAETFMLCDRISRRKLKEFEARGEDLPVFTPKGDMFAFFDQSDDLCHLWDTRRQTLIHSWEAGYPYKVALSDKQIAFYVYLSTQIWDIHTLTMVCKLHAIGLSSLFFAGDQHLISRPGNIYTVRDISTGKRIAESSLDDTILALAASSDSKYVALSTRDTIHVGPLSTPVKAMASVTMLRNGVIGLWTRGRHLVQFCCQPNYLLLISDTVTMISVVAAKPSSSLVAVSPRNDHVHVAFITIHGLSVWNDTEGEFILDKSTDITCLEYSPLGDRLISATVMGVIRIWDVNTRILIGGYIISGSVLALAFSATGANYVVAYRGRMSSTSETESSTSETESSTSGTEEEETLIEVRECQSGYRLAGPFKSVVYDKYTLFAISLSANETKIIWMTDSRIEILDAVTGQSEINRRDPSWEAPMGRLSPNSKYIGWCLKDQNRVELWDIDNQFLLHQLSPNGDLKDIFFSDDSSYIIIIYSTGLRYYLDLWETSTGRTAWQGVQVYSADCEYLALNGHNLILSDRRNPKFVNLNVLQLVSSFYEHHRNHSRFGMFPIDNSEAKREIQTLINSTSMDEDILEYALMAWDKALFSMGTEISEDGWLLGPHDELLLWIPKERRHSLQRPWMTYMDKKRLTKLNFDTFVHGTRWMECGGNL